MRRCVRRVVAHWYYHARADDRADDNAPHIFALPFLPRSHTLMNHMPRANQYNDIQATDIWTRALAIALVYRTSSGTKTVLLLVSLVVWAIADLVLQTWSKRNDADAQVGGVAAKDYLGNVNATVPVLLRASVVATISGLFNACPMSVQPRDRYRLFTVSSVVTSLMAIAAAIQLRADAVAGSTDASVSSTMASDDSLHHYYFFLFVNAKTTAGGALVPHLDGGVGEPPLEPSRFGSKLPHLC